VYLFAVFTVVLVRHFQMSATVVCLILSEMFARCAKTVFGNVRQNIKSPVATNVRNFLAKD